MLSHALQSAVRRAVVYGGLVLLSVGCTTSGVDELSSGGPRRHGGGAGAAMLDAGPDARGSTGGGAGASDGSPGTCNDGRKNGNETDIDCGGSCRGCVAGSTCIAATDCETAACDANVCRAASCSNGVRDSF